MSDLKDLPPIGSLHEFLADSVEDAPPHPLDSAVGTMLGLAVGNLLGLGVEGCRYQDIAEEYPGGLRDIDPGEFTRPMDDDLAQAVGLAEAILAPEDTVEKFAQFLLEWYVSNGRGCGFTTRKAIENLGSGLPPPEAAKALYDVRPIAPNGGVMRCAPVGAAYRLAPKKLIDVSVSTCTATHYAPTCRWSCILVKSALARLLNGSPPNLAAMFAGAEADGAGDLLGEARRDGIPSEVFAALSTGEDPPDSADWLYCDHNLIGHTLLAAQVGLWAAVTPLDFEAALVDVVNAGGDTDTNGAVAGAVLGARYGAGAIPERWLDCVRERERIASLAERLLQVG